MTMKCGGGGGGGGGYSLRSLPRGTRCGMAVNLKNAVLKGFFITFTFTMKEFVDVFSSVHED